MRSVGGWLERNKRFSDPVFRLCLSLIFIVGGLGHFVEQRQMLERMAASPWSRAINAVGDPALLLELSGYVFVVCGFALAFGFMTRLAVLLLFVTLVPITWTIHVAPGHAGPLFKNVAILGALVHVFFRGSGSYAVDGLARASRRMRSVSFAGDSRDR